jgi:anion-transporting  ArsA/GET3 family ATPase
MRRMPRLIHLNGPSGVGKSTVARMYADRHPGVLNLDTDQTVSLREIMVMAGKEQMISRFTGRAVSGDPALHRYIDEIVLRGGGPTLLAKIHDDRDAGQTYDAVVAALADDRSGETAPAD